MANDGKIDSVVGKGTVIDGDIKVKGSIKIDGTIKGSVTVKEKVMSKFRKSSNFKAVLKCLEILYVKDSLFRKACFLKVIAKCHRRQRKNSKWL
jgi:hypothetical protein